MNITGKDLKDLIPDEVVMSLENIGTHSKNDQYVVLSLECSEGCLQVIAYRKLVGKLLLKTAGPVQAPAPAPVAPATQENSPAPATAQEAQEEDEGGRKIGMTRRRDGKVETLKGFTESGSIREKPANCDRRVKHPQTGQMVWAIWE